MHDLEYIIYLKIPDLTATTKLLGGGVGTGANQW